MANLYCHAGNGTSTGYYAVAQWASGTVYSASTNGGRGDYVRQLAAPAVGSERVFRCTTAGTSGGSEPAWTLTKNGTTSDNTAGWTECTGQEADQVSGTWKAPHARMLNALAATWCAAGDTVYLSKNSTTGDTQSTALTLTSPGTAASPCRVICVDDAGTVPPVSADVSGGAVIATTGASNLNWGAHLYAEAGSGGITLSAGSAGNGASIGLPTATTTSAMTLKNFKLVLNNSNASSQIQLGSGSNTAEYLELVNTTMKFGSTSQGIRVSGGNVIWRDTPSAIDAAGSLPTTLYSGATNNCNFYAEGVDLSALGSGKTLVGANPGSTKFYHFRCKLGASVTKAATPAGMGAAEAIFTECDDGTKYYAQDAVHYLGTESVDSTVTRTGSTADTATATAVSKKYVTTANTKPHQPFQGLPIAVWNAVAGSTRTITLYGVWSGGAVPTNDDIWLHLNYRGSASSVISTAVSTAKANALAAAANTSTDASSWSGGTTAFKIVIALSSPAPAVAGPIYITPKFGAASATFYLDTNTVEQA